MRTDNPTLEWVENNFWDAPTRNRTLIVSPWQYEKLKSLAERVGVDLVAPNLVKYAEEDVKWGWGLPHQEPGPRTPLPNGDLYED